MTTEQEQAAAHYGPMAREHYAYQRKQILEIPKAERDGLELPESGHAFSGNAVISIVFGVRCYVKLTTKFDTGERLEFEGVLWGPIVGAGGISFGGGATGLSPAQLVAAGKMGCAISASPAGVVLTWGVNGTFVGGGPNVALGWAGGDGTWKKV